MKNVRLYFKKNGRMRFISHLDMNRFMIRIIRKAKLPIWYTEGFNPHPYVTFALPLSLGYIGEYEILDIRLVDDDFDISKICDILNSVCPPYINFFDAKEPIKKAGTVSFAKYEIEFEDNGILKEKFEKFLTNDQIICSKKTKKGDIKEFDILPKITSINLEQENGNTKMYITLPAGSVENVNPELLLNAFFQTNENLCCYTVTRTAILDQDKNLFK